MIEAQANIEESRETRIKRLTMRSMRRGIKEMDILLSGYAAADLAAMSDAQLALYDALLRENDQDLYQWVTGQTPAPERFNALVDEISRTYQK
ncbi:succinate dehydrogenase assembly factor 2 [Tritonibacter mobilis]|nr:succinate dehydrogenase assembly factor 2 [Tritonibacter mobilis]